MKAAVKGLLIICTVAVLTACGWGNGSTAETKTDRGSAAAASDALSFGDLEKRGPTGEIKGSDEIKKILLEVSRDGQLKILAIDLSEGKVYVNIKAGRIYRAKPDALLDEKQTEQIREIVDQFNVLKWERSFSDSDEEMEDGDSWLLVIEGDEAVDRHGGRGSSFSDITPDGFSDFVEALQKTCSVSY